MKFLVVYQYRGYFVFFRRRRTSNRYLTHFLLLVFISLFFYSCDNTVQAPSHIAVEQLANSISITPKKKNDSAIRTVHVFVALCDNKYQGIVPVGKTIGNGQDTENNLYWGCDNGVRTYFKKKFSDWILLDSKKNISSEILEQLLFKHKSANVYLLAEAYDGKYIRQTTVDFLEAASGKLPKEKVYQNDTLYFGGSSNLLSYIGHDGLMDFQLPLSKKSTDTSKKETIILACYSKRFFAPHLRQTSAQPLVWTTGLMAPEAYTLHDALSEWVKRKSMVQISEAAARAYAKYQRCSNKAAMNLLVSGW